jgi:hypothetical protein
MTKLLSSYAELPHFHFNESLCKPFENLLCLELCDGDVQDQVGNQLIDVLLMLIMDFYRKGVKINYRFRQLTI